MSTQKEKPADRTEGSYETHILPVSPLLIRYSYLQKIPCVIRRRWRAMLVAFILVSSIGIIYTLAFFRPVYQSTSLMVVSTDKMRNYAGGLDEYAVLSNLINLAKSRSIAGQMNLIKSPDLLGEVAQKLGSDKMIAGYGIEYADKDPVLPDWAVNVTSPKDSDMIAVTARAYDRNVAADLANTIVRIYLERDQGFSSQAAKQGRQYVENEITAVQKQLADAKTHLADFKKQTGLIAAESQIQTLASNFISLKLENDKAAIEASESRHQANALQRELHRQGYRIEESRTLQQNPQFQQILTRINELNASRAMLLQEYTPESIEIGKIDAQIDSAQKHLKKVAANTVGIKVTVRNPLLKSYLEAQIQSASSLAKAQSLREVVSQKSKELSKLPDTEKKLTRLIQHVSVLEQTYAMLSDKYYALLVNEKSTLPNSLFAASALPSKSAVLSRKKLVMVCVFTALLLAIAVAVIVENRDNILRDKDEFIRHIGVLPLSNIPDQILCEDGNQLYPEFVKGSAFAESFRILKNNILISDIKPDINIIAVTSASRGEGKSTVAVCLASAVAITGKSVLIVDCNLENPAISAIMGLNVNAGLIDLVNGTANPEDAIIPAAIANMFVLACESHPVKETEFLDTDRCRNILRTMASQFDMMIIDCPCAGMSDTQVVSTIVDGVLLVTACDITRSDILASSIQTLALVDAPFLGFVINREHV